MPQIQPIMLELYPIIPTSSEVMMAYSGWPYHCRRIRMYPPSTTHSTAPWHAADITSGGYPANANK